MVTSFPILYKENYFLKCYHLMVHENPRSIVVLDSCSIHHTVKVEGLFKQARILVIFLPPYNPDFNPAEELFSYVKYYLKEHDEVLQAMNDPIPLIQAASDSVSEEKCIGWIRICVTTNVKFDSST